MTLILLLIGCPTDFATQECPYALYRPSGAPVAAGETCAPDTCLFRCESPFCDAHRSELWCEDCDALELYRTERCGGRCAVEESDGVTAFWCMEGK